MIDAIKKLVRKLPFLRDVYALVGTRYHEFRTSIAAKKLFVNSDEFLVVLKEKGEGTVVMRTHDGLSITIRRNIYDARRVIVYEPTVENFKILKQNIENNSFQDRIIAVNKAVSDSDEIILRTEVLNGEEVHASRYLYEDAEHRRVPGVTLAELFESHQLDSVDLLKADCEGGEYDIFSSVPASLSRTPSTQARVAPAKASWPPGAKGRQAKSL